MIKFYKIINGKLISGSGESAPDDSWLTDWSLLTRIVLGQDENGEDILGEYYTDYNEDMTPDLTTYEANIKAQELKDWKAERQTAVDNIEVEYNGVIFQGDELSQERMARTATALEGKPDVVIMWTAKDNKDYPLKRANLLEVLLDAGTQQSTIWSQGRPSSTIA